MESLLQRGEGGGQPVMPLPCLAMLSPSGPWLLPYLLLVHWHKLPISSVRGSACLRRLHRMPCSKSAGPVRQEPLHCFPKGLRLKKGPMLTVPLRPREELSIPTAHSIKVQSFSQCFSTCCLTVISVSFSMESNEITKQ